MDSALADYVGVFLLGAAVGAGELISVFRDAPTRALLTRPAAFYVFVNAAAALAALFLIRVYGWIPADPTTPAETLRVTQVLVAGFGAMVFFRSSFTLHAGEKDVSVSPSVFLERLLNAARTDVDRQRAVQIDTDVRRIMANVSFRKARTQLPSYCFSLLQASAKVDQDAVATQVAALDTVPIDDRVKGLLLGAVLVKVVGKGVLEQAVNSLGDEIRESAREGDES